MVRVFRYSPVDAETVSEPHLRDDVSRGLHGADDCFRFHRVPAQVPGDAVLPHHSSGLHLHWSAVVVL